VFAFIACIIAIVLLLGPLLQTIIHAEDTTDATESYALWQGVVASLGFSIGARVHAVTMVRDSIGMGRSIWMAFIAMFLAILLLNSPEAILAIKLDLWIAIGLLLVSIFDIRQNWRDRTAGPRFS
jgi:hypothetical protein